MKEGTSEDIYYSDTERAYDGEDVLIISDSTNQETANQVPSSIDYPISGRGIKEDDAGTSEAVTEESNVSDSETVIISSLPQEENATEATDTIIFNETEPENTPEEVEQTASE